MAPVLAKVAAVDPATHPQRKDKAAIAVGMQYLRFKMNMEFGLPAINSINSPLKMYRVLD